MTRVPRRFAGIGAADLPDATAFDAYVGPSREIVVDPARGIIALHDGVTVGGKRALMASQRGVANGVAELGADTRVPASRLGNVSGMFPAAGSAEFLLNKVAATDLASIVGQVNGVNQWKIALGDASRNLAISRYDNTGTLIDTPLSIDKTSGVVTWKGRSVFSRTAGTGSTFTPDVEINVSESFSAGTGFYIPHAVLATKTGGSGHREALHVEQLSSASAVGEFVVGIQGQGRITAGSGSAFGLNGYVWVDAAAASTVEASAGEFNTDIRRSVARKVGLQVVDVSTSVGGGSSYDAGIMITKQSGGVGFSCGIQFGDASQFPVFAGGQIVAATGVIPTLASGINLAAVTTTVAAFVAKAGGNGLAFGADFGGGLIRSAVTSGAGIMTFNATDVEFSTKVKATGYMSRSGTSGAFSANYINFFWNTSTSKVDLYVDTNRIGAITTT